MTGTLVLLPKTSKVTVFFENGQSSEAVIKHTDDLDLHNQVISRFGQVTGWNVRDPRAEAYFQIKNEIQEAFYALQLERDQRRILEESGAGFPFHAQLARVNLKKIPAYDLPRSTLRKEQARLCRELFKRLGLRGASVTAPNYSMARSVDIRLPERADYALFEPNGCVDRDDPASVANAAAEKRVGEILSVAFPNHDDRSDSQRDHFDSCWSIN